ncbi:hypothetical protein ISCGN_013233 [Ixodes scapularis]
MGLDLGRHDKGGDELVQCEGCGRWCYLEETGFGSLEAAAAVMSFECRLCVKLEQVTGEWDGRVREIEAQLKVEEEKRLGLEAQIEELTRQLTHEREQRVGLEKQAEELGEVRSPGVTGGRESSLLAGGLDDAGELSDTQLNGAFEQQASGSQVTRDKSQDKGTQVPGGSSVLVVGSSNVARVKRGVHNRVKGDQRVTVEVQPGKCMVDAMTAAREGVWDNREGRNLVIVHAGLNDVLKGRSQSLGKQLNVGIRKLRDVSKNVHVVVCTIPEVRGQSGVTERRVVKANRVIKDVGSSLTALTSGTKTSPPTRVHGSCATRTEGKGKMDVLRARLRQLRTHNKRLQQRLQRRRHMLTVTEIVESVRSLVSPAVAALVEAQLKMTNASRFGRRWCSQNKEFALGLYF